MHTKSSYRIALDARFYRSGTGGIGRYSRELIKHLAMIDQVNQYTVILTPEDMKEWNLDQPNFTPVVLPIGHYTLAEQTKLWWFLMRQRFDLVHFLNYNHPLLYRRPFVTTLHDLTVYFFPVGKSQKSRLRRLAFVAVMKNSLKAAKRVISISEHTANDAERQLGIPHAKMEVVYHGAPEPFEAAFGSKAQVQKYLGTKAPYFLFVSQWRPHKGILTLIKAFEQFKEKTGAPHVLVLTGKQEASDEEVRTALGSSPYFDDIVTPGFVPDEILPALYRYSDAFVSPSEYEGFGLPILEAFNFGAPVIAAENSSQPEVGGKAALYFPTRDAEALAAVMQHVAFEEGLADSLRAAGDEQVKKFSWIKTAQRTLAVYMNVLEKGR